MAKFITPSKGPMVQFTGTIVKGCVYPLADYHPYMIDHINMLALWDGKRIRYPKEGEWYLAQDWFDNKIYAYRAIRKMISNFPIVGRIVGTKIQVIKDIVEIPLL